MSKFKIKQEIFEIVKLTENNLEEVEIWTNGSIKWTYLSRDQRVIDIQNSKGELRVEIGDIILKIGNDFIVIQENVFKTIFEEIKDDKEFN